MPFVNITRIPSISEEVVKKLVDFLKVAVPEEMGGNVEINLDYFDDLAWNNSPIRVSIVGQERRWRHRHKRDADVIARNLTERVKDQARQGRLHLNPNECDVYVLLVKSVGCSVRDVRYDMR